jgi:hypothetical protein
MNTPLAARAKAPLREYDFRDPVHRMLFEGSCAALGASQGDARELARKFAQLDDALAAGMCNLKRDLAASATCWGEAHHALGEWICRQHLALVELGGNITASAVRGFGAGAERELRLGFHAVRNMNEAAKWQLMVFATRARARAAHVGDTLA